MSAQGRRNLAVLGQKIIRGKPFRQMTKGTIACPLAKAAIDWLAAIAAGRVNPMAVSSQQAAAVMTYFCNARFGRYYSKNSVV
jgi:hypothetical protein